MSAKSIRNARMKQDRKERRGGRFEETLTWHKPEPQEPLDAPPPLKPHPRRHSNWEEVVDLQDELIRFWYTRLGHEYGLAFGQHMLEAAGEDLDTINAQRLPGTPEWDPEETIWALNLDKIERVKLQLANPMYVNEEVQTLIRAAAEHSTFELKPLRREDVFPNMYGFVVFPEPFIVIDTHGKNLAFRAISWTPYDHDGMLAKDFGSLVKPHEASGLLITGYTHRDDPDDYPLTEAYGPEEETRFRRTQLPIMSLCYVTPWGFDKEQTPIDMSGSGLNDFCKIVQTLWRLAQQTITVPERTTLPRAFRKRAARAELQSDVVVVRLRKAKKSKPDGEASAVEWSCRWTVGAGTGGFWRNQWYPKEGVHKQIWISPYVKGPEDKPLVVKPLRAYELTR